MKKEDVNQYKREKIKFYFNDMEIYGYKGQTIAGALLDNGIYKLGISKKNHDPRGAYCMNGRCYSCMVNNSKHENILACKTLIEENMAVTYGNNAILTLKEVYE